MQSIIKLVFRIFVFLLPTQLAYHFWPDWALVFGIRVDYLAPAIYLTDIIALVLILFSIFQKQEKIFTKKDFKFLVPTLSFVFLNILFAEVPMAALFKWGKILELYLIYLFVKNNKLTVFYKDFLQPLILSSFFVSTIGVLQFLKGQTLGGPLYLLGERSFGVFTPGISLVKVFGRDFLRAYSTFSHPNSLAGFLSIVIIFMTVNKERLLKKWFYIPIFGVVLLGFVLSFSTGALLAIILSFLFYAFLKKRPWVALFLVTTVSISLLFFQATSAPPFFSKSVQERLVLANVAKEIFLKNPTFGVGLNNFTASKISWTLQPVHNSLLLVLAETGLVGASLFLLGLYRLLRKVVRLSNPGIFISLLFILFAGVVDHYFLTLQQNTLLFFIVLGYSQKRNNE